MEEPRTFYEGLAFGEGPRWHQGALWLSDMHGGEVLRIEPDGRARVMARVAGRPSGLGWLPDGRLLVVSMTDRRLLRQDGDALALHADLSGLASFDCNDMVVDAAGRAYVGNFGFDLHARAEPRPAELLRVDPDGSARVVARELAFPNGAVISPDGGTLVVGESFGRRLSAFDRLPDGSLTHRRVWAELGEHVPDGICLDAEGAIWVASPLTRRVLRVREGGTIAASLETADLAIACMLGGSDRRTLYVLTSPTIDPDECRAKRAGRVLAWRVEVPGAGFP